MTGDKVGHMRGIIPRSVEQIVEQVVLMRESGWEIIVTASMVRTFKIVYTPVLTFSFLSLLTMEILILLSGGVEYNNILLFLF